jgi:hypothetical protein
MRQEKGGPSKFKGLERQRRGCIEFGPQDGESERTGSSENRSLVSQRRR